MLTSPRQSLNFGVVPLLALPPNSVHLAQGRLPMLYIWGLGFSLFASFFAPNTFGNRQERDPATCLADAKASRVAKAKKMRAPHTSVEKEFARQNRLDRHLGDFMSCPSGVYSQAELDELSAKHL